MKVYIAANAPWVPTGYGSQGASLALRLKRDGHKVVYQCNYGLKGGIVEWNGIPCLPTPSDHYADPIFEGHVRAYQPDLVITLVDAWVYRGFGYPVANSNYKVAMWAPIDHDPISRANVDVLENINYPIAMSEHGKREMESAGLRPTFIPHGVEKAYHYTAGGRQEMRRYHEIEKDAFVFGAVGLNMYYPNRKAHDRLLEAFAQMPQGAYLYIHTLPFSQAGSIDLRDIAKYYGVLDRVKFPDTYNMEIGYSQNGMNAIYSMFDCFLQPTMGEGFGIPVLEAQACGCVVIATDCTSMPGLLCPEASVLVPPATTVFTPDLAKRYLIDIGKMADAMHEAIQIKQEDPTGFRAMKARCGLWANNWDWERIWQEAWVPFLALVEDEIAKSPKTKWRRGGALAYEKDGLFRKEDSQARSVKKELDLLLTLAHPNIIPVVSHGETNGCWWFDMPLYRPLMECELTAEQKDRVRTGIKSALDYLHSLDLAHRDVHPSNVVLDEDCNPYLVDFAWAASCDGPPCVDYEPWKCLGHAVPSVQLGADERGYHTIEAFLSGGETALKKLKKSSATGMAREGLPYQPIEGVEGSERQCQDRWEIMRPNVKGKRVLDVGCNAGWFVRKSLEEGAVAAVGVDADEPIVELARSLGPGDFRQMNIHELDGDMGHFDIAFVLSVLQHVDNPHLALDKVLALADETYVEIPPRFITQSLAQRFKNSPAIGESERGRPIFKVLGGQLA